MGDTLYFTAFDNTYVIDGATCRQKWKYNRPEPDSFLKANRGVGYSDGRVFRRLYVARRDHAECLLARKRNT